MKKRTYNVFPAKVLWSLRSLDSVHCRHCLNNLMGLCFISLTASWGNIVSLSILSF